MVEVACTEEWQRQTVTNINATHKHTFGERLNCNCNNDDNNYGVHNSLTSHQLIDKLSELGFYNTNNNKKKKHTDSATQNSISNERMNG